MPSCKYQLSLSFGLVLSVFALSACSNGQQNNNTFPETRSLSGTRALPQSVVLPRSIDASGRPHRLQHGTAVYVVTTRAIRWKAVQNGVSTEHIAAGYNVQSVNRSGHTTTITLVDGTKYTVPNDAVLSARTERDIGFVAPGAQTPSILLGRKPDYIVP